MDFMMNIDPSEVFKSELNCITNEWYTKCFLEAISKAPSCFWVIPSSTSGKYHPEADLGVGGNVRHTKAVFWVLEELLSNIGLYPFTDDQKDSLRVAALLHDSVKTGLDGGNHTVHNHPMLIRDNLCPTDKLLCGIEEREKWSYICDLIESHMGMWNTSKRTDTEGDKVILPLPDTKEKQLLHLSDFIASKRRVSVSVVSRDSGSSYNSSEPATESQKKYITGLIQNCTKKGIELNSSYELSNLKKSEASKIIKNLLELLK